MTKRLVLKITGFVQGVNFRSFIKTKADELKLTGFVKNENDGSVTVEAQGEENNLEKLLHACQTGPQYARVSKTVVNWEAPNKNLSNFTVNY